MSETSIQIILVLGYIIFLIAFAIYSVFALYHLRTFGYVGDACQLMIYVYSMIAIIIIVSSILILIF